MGLYLRGGSKPGGDEGSSREGGGRGKSTNEERTIGEILPPYLARSPPSTHFMISILRLMSELAASAIESTTALLRSPSSSRRT